MANTRDKDISTVAASAAVDDWNRKDGATNGTRRISPFDEAGQFRNALAPGGGIYALGNLGTVRVNSTLTNQALGTDDFSVSLIVQVPSSNPSAINGVFAISSSATDGTQAGAVVGYIDTTSNFRARIYGATTSDYNEISLSVSAWANKRIHLVLTRTGSTVALYINGVAQTVSAASAGTPPTWAGSLTSTYLNVGFLAAATYLVGVICRVALYNLLLTGSDVLEVFEIGGGVPDRFKNTNSGAVSYWGSQLALTLTTAQGSWSTYSYSGGVLSASTASGGFVAGNLIPNPNAKAARYRFKYSLVLNSGVAPVLGDGNTLQTARLTAGGTPQIIEFTGYISQLLYGNGFAASDFTMTITSLTYIGAVVYLPLDEGVGFQAFDASANKLHAIIVAGGASHAIGKAAGRIRFTTNTNGNQQILGQQALPASARIRSWTIDSAGTPTVKLGNASAGAQFFAAAAIAAGLNDITLLTRFCSTNNLWCNSTTTDALQHTIEYELVD